MDITLRGDSVEFFSVVVWASGSGDLVQPDSDLRGDGKLLFPANYREWIYLSSGVDMSYSPNAMDMGHSMFDNVFVNPDAYKAFLQTGTWPDKTMLVLEVRVAGNNASSTRAGISNARTDGTRSPVRDDSHFDGKWAFFGFDTNGAVEDGAQRSGLLFVPSAARSSGHYVRTVLSHADWNCEGQGNAERGVFEG